jgi:hypothetical protein
MLLSGLFLSSAAFGGSQSLDGITLTNVAPKIITPNGDGFNDAVYFYFDTSVVGLPLDSNVYDLSGANISSLKIDLDGAALSWNGRTSAGESVPSGIYIYMIKLGKKTISGTVVVAK